MTELHIAVDHLKIDYKGAFEFNNLIRLITSFTKESGYDIKYDKDFEINTKTGKQYDYQIYPWKKITDYTRYSFKIQISTVDMVKVDAERDGKKVKVDFGRLMVFIDAFYDLDYFDKWDAIPMFQFIRTLFNKFVYKIYTERFEQRLVYDAHLLYDRIQKFLNMYKSFKVITKQPNTDL